MRTRWQAATLSALFVVAFASVTHADDCLSLGGTPAGGECQVTGPVVASDALHGGPFVLAQTLRITGAGSITVPPQPGGAALTLVITGDLVIELPSLATGGRIVGAASLGNPAAAAITVEATGNIALEGDGAAGARIAADQPVGACPAGRGGTILLSAGQSVAIADGAAVTADSVCGAGEITILAGLSAQIDGLVSSQGSTTSGQGGPVTVKAACTLKVGPTGEIVSEGSDPGADLVHLEGGCAVLIQGRIASTGPGRGRPPQNRCHDYADKPADAPACIEVWSGGTITVDATGANRGELDADTAQSGGVSCCAWIDLMAAGAVTIAGAPTGIFAVHANQSVTNAFGGYVRVVSTGGTVTATGMAIQVNATRPGGRGGAVTIEAAANVTLDEGWIEARGDSLAAGGLGAGGGIAARAFGGSVSWQNPAGGVVATGEVEPTGAGVSAGQRGSIALTSCAPPLTAGTVFPVTAGAATAPVATGGVCPPPAAPSLPDYVVLPACQCPAPGPPDVSVEKSTTTPAVFSGGTASYTITVRSNGGAATGVVMTDVLPPGFAWVVGGPDAGACSITAGTLTCDFDSMAAGATATVIVSAAVPAASSALGIETLGSSGCHCRRISNTAEVTAASDANPNNNVSGPVEIAIDCADVSVTKKARATSVAVGETAKYTIKVTSKGPGEATDVVMIDRLPKRFTWTVGGPDAGACTIAAGRLVCDYGTMAAGTTRKVTVSATVTSSLALAAAGGAPAEAGVGIMGGGCGKIANRAFVRAAVDTNRGNNSSGWVTIAVKCPVLGH